MKFQIKNITGDSTSTNPDLVAGKTLYATSGQLQQLLPVGPQQTAFISSKALVELTAICPTWFTVLDTDGSVDDTMPRRTKVTVTSSWQYVDLGRFAGQVSFTNPGSGIIQFSLSGGAGIGTAPATTTISDVLANETITISDIMEPIRYVYVKGDGTSTIVYILSS